jgi:hypothetical protein
MDIILASTPGITCGHCAHVMNVGLEYFMGEKAQDSVYSFVERAYMRLQAGDVLIRCLEEKKISPMQEMVEGLVFAGPDNIATLREIMDETIQRKTQVQDDLHQVITQVCNVFESYGITLDEGLTSDLLREWTASNLVELMTRQGIKQAETHSACLQVWQNSQEIMENLFTNLQLLNEVEHFLQDWLWGLAYQQVRMAENGSNLQNGGQQQ